MVWDWWAGWWGLDSQRLYHAQQDITLLTKQSTARNWKWLRASVVLAMGVNHLWTILDCVKRQKSLASLSGKTLCVDLSGWICEAQCSKGLKASVVKPHLRNLFFRVLHFTRLGVKLVFVTDGAAPELKWEAISKRSQARFGGPVRKPQKRGGKVGRSNFQVWVREVNTVTKKKNLLFWLTNHVFRIHVRYAGYHLVFVGSVQF